MNNQNNSQRHFQLNIESIQSKLNSTIITYPDLCLLVSDVLCYRFPISDLIIFKEQYQESIATTNDINTTTNTINSFPNVYQHFDICDQIGYGAYSRIFQLKSKQQSTTINNNTNSSLNQNDLNQEPTYVLKELPIWSYFPFPSFNSSKFQHLPTLNTQSQSISPSTSQQQPTLDFSTTTNTNPSSQQHLSQESTQSRLELYNQLFYHFLLDEADTTNMSDFSLKLNNYTEREYIQITHNLIIIREIATLLYLSLHNYNEIDNLLPLIMIVELNPHSNNNINNQFEYEQMERQIGLVFPLFSHSLQDLITMSTCITNVNDLNQQQQMNQNTELESIHSTTQPKPFISPFPTQQSQYILKSILNGLSILHQHGIIHRDIKPSNILINQLNGQIVIADFGSTRYYSQLPLADMDTEPNNQTPMNEITVDSTVTTTSTPDQMNIQNTIQSLLTLIQSTTMQSIDPIQSTLSSPFGTLAYRPIDILLLNPLHSFTNIQHYPGHAIDIYSVGCITFQLFLGSYSGLLPLPFFQPNLILSFNFSESNFQHQIQSILEQGLFSLSIYQSKNGDISNKSRFQWNEFTIVQYLINIISPYPHLIPFQISTSLTTESTSHQLQSGEDNNNINNNNIPNVNKISIELPPLIEPNDISNFIRQWPGYPLIAHIYETLLEQQLDVIQSHVESNSTTIINAPSQFIPSPLPSFQHILTHSQHNFLSWLLSLLPQQRPTATTAMKHIYFDTSLSNNSSHIDFSQWLYNLIIKYNNSDSITTIQSVVANLDHQQRSNSPPPLDIDDGDGYGYGCDSYENDGYFD